MPAISSQHVRATRYDRTPRERRFGLELREERSQIAYRPLCCHADHSTPEPGSRKLRRSNTYALRRRAFRALEELLNTDDSLTEIALCCGFYDQGTPHEDFCSNI